MRHPWLLLCLLVSLALGCPFGPPVGDDDDDDDSAGDDDDDDDATGDDDTGDDDDMFSGGTDGSLGLMFTHTANAGFGVVSGTFANIITPATPGYETEIPVGMDSCALTPFTMDELQGGDPGEYEYQSAGTITVDGGGLSLELEPEDLDGTLTYQQTLIEAQLTFGIDYDVSASGGEFPAFTGVLPMTDRLTITTPDLGGGMFPILDGPLDVEWSGADGSDAALFLTLTGEDKIGAVVVCIVTNDGSFSIPANVIDQLPSGTGTLLVEQYNWTETTVQGRSLALFAGSAGMGLGMKP